MKSSYISVLRYFSLHKALLKCLFTVSQVSVVRLIKSIVRGVLPIMAYTGRLHPKGVPFSGFGCMKG